VAIRTALGLALLVSINGAVAEPTEQDLVRQAQLIAAEFQANLKSALMQAMSTGGPVSAIDVCQLESPNISGELSGDGWVVARTALKVRNPANAPSSWQRSQMESMVQALAAGEKPATLTVADIREGGEGEEGRTFYYMQPIMTAKLCLTCHGAQLAPDVQQALNNRYPTDQAVGFSEGDLRGAFAFTKTLSGD
jgi:hypothetical protein